MAAITVVTLNSWKCDGDYPARLEPMAEGLAALAPDFVLLQESFRSDDRAADTAAFLARRLGMHADFRPARRKPRQFLGAERVSESGLAVLSRHPLGPGRTVALPSDPADGERIAQLVPAAVGGDTVLVLNLHLTHLPDAAALRRAQAAVALSAIDGEAGHAAAIVGGDFNATPDDPGVRAVAARPGVLDAAAMAGFPPTLADGERCIDHLFSLPGAGRTLQPFAAARVLDRAGAAGLLPSDHYGLLLRFALGP